MRKRRRRLSTRKSKRLSTRKSKRLSKRKSNKKRKYRRRSKRMSKRQFKSQQTGGSAAEIRKKTFAAAEKRLIRRDNILSEFNVMHQEGTVYSLYEDVSWVFNSLMGFIVICVFGVKNHSEIALILAKILLSRGFNEINLENLSSACQGVMTESEFIESFRKMDVQQHTMSKYNIKRLYSFAKKITIIKTTPDELGLGKEVTVISIDKRKVLNGIIIAIDDDKYIAMDKEGKWIEEIPIIPWNTILKPLTDQDEGCEVILKHPSHWPEWVHVDDIGKVDRFKDTGDSHSVGMQVITTGIFPTVLPTVPVQMCAGGDWIEKPLKARTHDFLKISKVYIEWKLQNSRSNVLAQREKVAAAEADMTTESTNPEKIINTKIEKLNKICPNIY